VGVGLLLVALAPFPALATRRWSFHRANQINEDGVRRRLGEWLAEHTPLYRVFVYAFVCLVFLGWSLWKRDALVITLTGSGLLYELSLAIGVNAPDFRYAHWMITCTCFK
jgi:hypothetical protein